MDQRKIKLDDVEGNTRKDIFKNLKGQGIKGLKSKRKKFMKTKDFSL